jgi:hypothetical protein
MSIDDRHRDKNGEISRKHGNTLVSTLRRIYGPSSQESVVLYPEMDARVQAQGRSALR